MKHIAPFTLALSLLLLVGCGKPAQEVESEQVAVPPVFVEQPITGTPVSIPKARTQFKAGDEVVLTGLVMGVPAPFVEGRAVFVLGDDGSMAPCTDGCSMPWDACCDSESARMAGTATIQVVDENGKPLRLGLKGINGLSELSRVTVAGTVAPNASAQAFIVNASAIHIDLR